MFKSYSKKTLLILSLIGLLSSFTFASEYVPDTSTDQLSYLFHLYYDNGQLFADRDVEFKYDIISEVFVSEVLNTQFPYKGEVVNLKGEVAQTFQFDPRQGNPKFLKGKILVKAPYISDGQKAVFYNNQGDALLTIFVQESSFCNDDGVCNPDVGEDTKTCPSDCKQVLPVPVVSPSVPTSGGGVGMLKGIIYLIIGLGLVGGWFGHRRWRGPAKSGGWKWWKKRRKSSIIQFPQNPNVQ